jgi:hypothetical protein
MPAAATSSTDADGRFVFTGLAPGTYRIDPRRDNFQYIAPGTLDQIALSPGDRKTGIVVRITPFSAVSGRVQNEEGDPLQNVQVNVVLPQYTADGRQMVPRGGATTNDLGEYRIFGIPSGKYFLRAATFAGQFAMPGSDESYAPTFYPGVTDASGAASMELAAGQDMRGIDFTLRRARGVSIRGRVSRPPGATFVSVSVSGGAIMGAFNNGTNDPDGKFEIRPVPPGAYTLTANARVGEKSYMAERPIQVGAADIEGIELTLAPSVDVHGLVRIEGNASVKLSQLRVNLTAPRQGNGANVNDDGVFLIQNVPPVVYRPVVYSDALFIKAVRCGTADVTDSGVDLTGGAGCDLAITLSANTAQIEGRVQDAGGKPVENAQVTLLPRSARRDDLFRQAFTDDTGHFKMAGLAPGSYRLYAWEQVDTGAVRWDPDFLRPFENQGQNLQLSEGDKQTVDLKPIPKPAAQ